MQIYIYEYLRELQPNKACISQDAKHMIEVKINITSSLRNINYKKWILSKTTDSNHDNSLYIQGCPCKLNR
jgi:hypothetical protein